MGTIPKGKYRHCKGGIYIVDGEAVWHADGTPVVIYRDSRLDGAVDPKTYVRLQDEFIEEVSPGVKRFEFICAWPPPCV